MSRQSTCWCAYSSRTFSFELNGEKIDPNLSQSHGKEKEKEDDHHVCLSSRPWNNRSIRTISFELFGEKIVPNLINQSYEQEKEDHHGHRFLNGNISNLLFRSNSMGDLDACNNEPDFMDYGYLSDGFLNESSHYIHDKNKGLPWSRDEHRSFLMGIEKLGKGKWREISKKYVQSRTPTQVASHAQKYFIKIKARDKGKRRSSLFDMPNQPMRCGNYSNEHKSSNLECSRKVPFDPNLNRGAIYPFNNNWTQRTSQAPLIPRPLTLTYGSPPWGGVASSSSKEEVPRAK